MRAVFVTYLIVIVAGLTYFTILGLTHQLMRRLLREQSLSLVFGALFLAALAGQAFAGWHDYNNLETWHAQMAGETPETLSFGRYVTTSSFAQAVTENWQSEYLQFTLFILLHRLVRAEGLAGVQAAGRGGRRVRRGPARRARTRSRARRSGRRRAAGARRSTATRW